MLNFQSFLEIRYHEQRWFWCTFFARKLLHLFFDDQIHNVWKSLIKSHFETLLHLFWKDMWNFAPKIIITFSFYRCNFCRFCGKYTKNRKNKKKFREIRFLITVNFHDLTFSGRIFLLSLTLRAKVENSSENIFIPHNKSSLLVFVPSLLSSSQSPSLPRRCAKQSALLLHALSHPKSDVIRLLKRGSLVD